MPVSDSTGKGVRKGLLFCVSGIVVFAVVIGIYAIHLRNSAQTLIASARQIRSAADAEVQIAMWRRKFSGEYSEYTEGNQGRVYQVQLDNRLLSWLHIIPSTVLFVSVGMQERSLGDVLVLLATEANGQRSASVHVIFGGKTLSRNPNVLSVNGTVDASGRPKSTVVELTSQVPPAEKEKAFAFDARCLVKLGGCKDAAEILPSVRD